MLIARQEYFPTIEINTGRRVDALKFTANGEYLVSGSRGGVQVWRVKDGERVATMKADDVLCLAVSKDGRFIAAGSDSGNVLVWDATNYEQVFAGEQSTQGNIRAVDFSPDSTRLVSAKGWNYTATILDVASRKQVQTLDHDKQWVGAAKYSPEGDRG